jgi:hypothetical protein
VRLLAVCLAIASLTWVGCSNSENGRERFREISLAELRDRIEGGWAGQMIGVSFGEPTEFRYLERIIEPDDLPEWTKERVVSALNQDDLYVEMTFSQVLDEKGLDATTEDFGAMFRDARYRLWHANLAARRALKRGVPAGESGTPRHNVHANDIDFQIESDFIGLMSPGLPAASNDLCWRVGRVMNSGDGIYGGMFVSAMYAAAFFEKDPRAVVEIGLGALPKESPYARVVTDVLRWSAENPTDWEATWQLIEDKWNDREPCPQGALNPFNIDAKLNGAYIALGLLYGNGDLERTLEIATRAGQDSDCNPSSALGILGVMMGFEGIPEKWRGGIPAIADEKFSYTNHSFHSIVESTMERAISWVERHGGHLEGDTLHVPVQAPVPARLEIWDDYGSPVERIATNDPRWSFEGAWNEEEMFSFGSKADIPIRWSDERDATAMVRFEGTGAVLVGTYLPDGGKAVIELDGEPRGIIDVYSDEDESKGNEALWHVFGLEDGAHELQLRVLGEPYPGSNGSKVWIEDIVVFR